MNMIFVLFALLGHAFLWIGLVNRLHAIGIRRWIVKSVTLGLFACAAMIPIFLWRGRYFQVFPGWRDVAVSAYFIVCWTIAPITLVRLAWMRWRQRTPAIVRFHGRSRVAIDVGADNDESPRGWSARLPGNEIFHLETTRWTFDVPRLAPALDGLSIVHLSDFHLTGIIDKAYFREVVRAANALQPDLTMLAGDLLDAPDCFNWIADTLGQLTARHGVYFVLGNHDLRVDADRLRRVLERCGLIDLGGQSRQIEIAGHPIRLLGNERPWFNRVPCVACESGRESVESETMRPLCIALAHTPDQLGWARASGVDLLLTGHTHGGQIRIPPLGAIFSPTFSGVKYISGLYHVAPTIMHVTRGVSGDVPVRWNCLPEIAHLRLRAPAGVSPPQK